MCYKIGKNVAYGYRNIRRNATCSSQISKNTPEIEFRDMITRTVTILQMMKGGKITTQRRCQEMDTILTSIEVKLLRWMSLYDVFGFLRSQFLTQGTTICVQDSIGAALLPLSVIGVNRVGSFVLLVLCVCLCVCVCVCVGGAIFGNVSSLLEGISAAASKKGDGGRIPR